MFYIGDDIRVIMEVNEALAGSTVKVCYLKPHSTTVVEDDPTSVDTVNDTVTYDLPKLINQVVGKWRFWVQVTTVDMLTATSTEVEVTITKH